MERIAVIDHETHTLFVEDVDEKLLSEKYNGEEEAYIKDNYYTLGRGNFSWDYISDAQYIPDNEKGEVYDIDFKQLTD
mgnify:CR=1 FL=1